MPEACVIVLTVIRGGAPDMITGDLCTWGISNGVFAGLDVSLWSCAICVVDGKGAVLHERELPCQIEEIAG
ncbi:hypothetical protein [uncultured Ruegeria sp.]|uniref:hypothetical protein n=2 Tax=uncultured Ruegeria sp. TaxID=259304 RepID=UPI00262DF5A7|nr:hypothetical protein [uncultured Ruegeria sp.]